MMIKLGRPKGIQVDETLYFNPLEDIWDNIYLGGQYVHPIEVQYEPDDLNLVKE